MSCRSEVAIPRQHADAFYVIRRKGDLLSLSHVCSWEIDWTSGKDIYRTQTDRLVEA